MTWRCLCSLFLTGASLSACAVQPRLYSTGELARVAVRCGVASTEVAQISPELELLYLLTLEPSDEQLECATRWAKRRGLTLVYVASATQLPELQTDQGQPAGQ
jgi:hypothetical protein